MLYTKGRTYVCWDWRHTHTHCVSCVLETRDSGTIIALHTRLGSTQPQCMVQPPTGGHCYDWQDFKVYTLPKTHLHTSLHMRNDMVTQSAPKHHSSAPHTCGISALCTMCELCCGFRYHPAAHKYHNTMC